MYHADAVRNRAVFICRTYPTGYLRRQQRVQDGFSNGTDYGADDAGRYRAGNFTII